MQFLAVPTAGQDDTPAARTVRIPLARAVGVDLHTRKRLRRPYFGFGFGEVDGSDGTVEHEARIDSYDRMSPVETRRFS